MDKPLFFKIMDGECCVGHVMIIPGETGYACLESHKWRPLDLEELSTAKLDEKGIPMNTED